MAASSVAEAFNWTPFSHGFVFWESPKAEHGPPSDQAGQREWLEGFQQAHADDPIQMHSINRNISKRFLKYDRSTITTRKQTTN